MYFIAPQDALYLYILRLLSPAVKLSEIPAFPETFSFSDGKVVPMPLIHFYMLTKATGMLALEQQVQVISCRLMVIGVQMYSG